MLIFAETVLMERKKSTRIRNSAWRKTKVQITGPTSHQIKYYRTRALAHFTLPDHSIADMELFSA